MKETLRSHTALASNGFTGFVAGREGTKISGNGVSQNVRAQLHQFLNDFLVTNILTFRRFMTISPYCANLSEQTFRDPDVFIPEQWLNGPGYENDRKDVFQPFSVGPRDCPGKR